MRAIVRTARLGMGAVVLAAMLGPAPAVADEPGFGPDNVRVVARLPELKGTIAINFIGDTMFVSTVQGVYSYDVSDPTSPQLLDVFVLPVWENEDMDVDTERDLVFVSRDPRGFVGGPFAPGVFPYGAVHIIDASNPRLLRPVSTFLLPAGHTTTCVSGCDYLWTGGPVPGVQQPADWGGRPIFATDIRDPENPVPCPEPIDTGRNDGATDYVHDVQVDARGVAWSSGAGGVRGYWTEGRHRNPLTGEIERATGCDPIPYAGGGTPEEATPSRFMHNSWRNVDARYDGSRGKVLYATEEEVTGDCANSGRFVTYDLRGSFGGQGWENIDETHFRMKVLDTWTPEGAAGSDGCASSHYFDDRGDGLLAAAFYDQGVRFLDVSDPAHIEQVGYYRPDEAQTWAAYWHGDHVFVADIARGVTVLAYSEPAVVVVDGPLSDSDGNAVRLDPRFGYMCPLDPPEAAPLLSR